MDEDEDDVHRKGLQHWPSSQVQIKQTDTAGRAPVSPDSMLPCRVHVEPRRFLYGNAGLLLLASLSRSRPPHVVLRQNLRMMDPEESVETLIGQKLQLIGDQFYQEHMMACSQIRCRVCLSCRSVWMVACLCAGRSCSQTNLSSSN
uniref:Bcl-2-modifying factor n=1 Tax=Cyprinus carpio carpio TaxID=630221 RepID=A0A9J7Z5T7_CYPCA